MTIEKICIILSILIFCSVYFLRFSKKFNIPTLIIYLTVGMLAGSEGLGGLEFDNPALMDFTGNIALCFILFAGAFTTPKEEVSPVMKEGLLLSFIGVALNTLLVALPVYFFTPFNGLSALLFGAIVSSTDASAVMSILSFSKLNIKRRVGSILKLESGSNDPMANVLIILLVGVIKSGEFHIYQSFIFLVLQILVGGLSGYLMAKAAVFTLKRFQIKMPEIHQMMTISFILATYGVTNLLHGNGFLAIFVFGIFLGNSDINYKVSIGRFFESSSWLLQTGMFVMLGLPVFPSQLFHIWKVGLGAAIILTLVARPLSVFLTLFKNKLKKREKLFIAWGGLKGAVPIIFSTIPMVEGIENSELIFNLVFFVVLFSVILQGMTLPFISRLLGLQEDKPSVMEKSDLESLEYFEERLVRIRIRGHYFKEDIRVSELELPKNILLVLIARNSEKILPHGDTSILSGDILYILSDSLETLDHYIHKIKELSSIDVFKDPVAPKILS